MPTKMMDIGLVSDDLDFEQGDFTNVESTQQHQRQLLINDKGTFKENPTICVGLWSYMDNENFADIMSEIRVEYARDGMQVDSINLNNNNINVDAYYP
ncbi:MAG: hypothetical protein JSS96_17515 [Bacteroidetes bacterium]|nr:hypothetical protein [Bacteroidota bacterium]